ncbi:hypothetical protein [Thiolinea disciformis]|uniref:hypothetical protein n=1 Tax=Thiolinea disciformis TaxID=125614 RepID=UPI0003623E6B|nr:hypothetical protein [Thiolinea disciformis]
MQITETFVLPNGIIDARPRFREIYTAVQQSHPELNEFDCAVDEALLVMRGEAPPTGRPVYLGDARLKLHFVIIPGLFADCLSYQVSPFNRRMHLHEHGYQSSILWVNGRSSCAYNAEMIHKALAFHDPDVRLVFVGYSKGVVDALQAVVSYNDLRDRTAAIVSLAGAVYGSYMANRVPFPISWLVSNLRIGSCHPGDGKSVQSLQPALRHQWLEQHPLPSTIRYFSLAGTPLPDKVSRALKLHHAMLNKRHPLNDSQVLYQDAMIPNSQFLACVNADHFAIALPLIKQWPFMSFLLNHNNYPRELLLESIVRYVEEQLVENLT